MPIVQLHYNDEKISGSDLRDLIGGLTAVVATQMTVESRGVNIEQKNVRVFTSQISKYDCNVDDLTINIFAHPYEERIAQKKEITKSIRSGVDYFLAELKNQLSVLVHVVFADIEIG